MTSSFTKETPLSKVDGVVTQFKNRLSLAGCNLGLMEAVNDAPDNALALAMVEAAKSSIIGRREVKEAKAVQFTHPRIQIMIARSWNRIFKLGFTEEQFAELERTIPEIPPGRLVAVTLVISLETVEKTVMFLWERAVEAHRDSWISNQIRFGAREMRLIDHESFPKGMRWEVVDLGANIGRSSDRILATTTRPRPYTVLASAAMHWLWVAALTGDADVPFVYEASIESSVPGNNPGRHVLGVCFDRSQRRVGLYAGNRGIGDSHFSVPVPVAA
jgi:hypothetical protein